AGLGALRAPWTAVWARTWTTRRSRASSCRTCWTSRWWRVCRRRVRASASPISRWVAFPPLTFDPAPVLLQNRVHGADAASPSGQPSKATAYVSPTVKASCPDGEAGGEGGGPRPSSPGDKGEPPGPQPVPTAGKRAPQAGAGGNVLGATLVAFAVMFAPSRRPLCADG
ncbi:unnamed protein product, partial [Tetraodon nigroviridis]